MTTDSGQEKDAAWELYEATKAFKKCIAFLIIMLWVQTESLVLKCCMRKETANRMSHSVTHGGTLHRDRVTRNAFEEKRNPCLIYF